MHVVLTRRLQAASIWLLFTLHALSSIQLNYNINLAVFIMYMVTMKLYKYLKRYIDLPLMRKAEAKKTSLR